MFERLSDDEIEEVIRNNLEEEDKDLKDYGWLVCDQDKALCKAQRQKMLKEFVEWGDSECPHCQAIPADHKYDDWTKRSCNECWEELVKLAEEK